VTEENNCWGKFTYYIHLLDFTEKTETLIQLRLQIRLEGISELMLSSYLVSVTAMNYVGRAKIERRFF
jgi:hypothetical protein